MSDKIKQAMTLAEIISSKGKPDANLIKTVVGSAVLTKKVHTESDNSIHEETETKIQPAKETIGKPSKQMVIEKPLKQESKVQTDNHVRLPTTNINVKMTLDVNLT